MTGKRKTIILIAVFAALLIGAAALYNSLSKKQESAPLPDAPPEAAQGEQAAEPAPDFTMLNSDGNEVALSDFLGKPTVLNFWASWCGPCRVEMPAFDALASELEGEVNFVMVNLTDGSRETIETASKFIEESGYGFPVYYDSQSMGVGAYSVRSIPVTYFIDASGVARAYSAGSMSEETLREGIAMITD